MSDIILPRLSQTGSNEWDDVEANDKAIRDVVNGGLDNDNLSGAAGITRANLAALAKPLRWYAPSIIDTEQSRTNTAMGLLETPDEVEEVVLPSGGLIWIMFRARMKSSKEGKGRCSLFLNSTEIRNPHNEAGISKGTDGTDKYDIVYADQNEMKLSTGSGGGEPAPAGTGNLLGGNGLLVFADPGTYDVSARFNASEGSVTAKERRLYVVVMGATA